MKRALILVIIGVVIGGSAVWLKMRGGPAEKPAEAEASAPEEEKTTLGHDTNGNVVIKMSDETQGDAGIQVANPAAAQFSPELKGYGRVEDPTALATALSELTGARAVYVASSNELARLKILESQGNASARATQAAEAAATHDLLAVESAEDRLMLAWGPAIAQRSDLAGVLKSLTAGDAALVRVFLPAGESPPSPPEGARVVSLSGGSVNADFLGSVGSVDPQTLGRGYFLLLKPNMLRLAPGEAVTAYLKLSGDALAGVIIPRAAVVRTEGTGWVYVLGGGGTAFTRTPIALDHSTEAGWFVTQGVTAADYVVVTGAQTLLSEELKAALSGD